MEEEESKANILIPSLIAHIAKWTSENADYKDILTTIGPHHKYSSLLC